VTFLYAAGILGGAVAALPHAVSAVGKAFSLTADATSTNNTASVPPASASESSIASLTKRLASLVRLAGVQPSDDIVVSDDGRGGAKVSASPQVAGVVSHVLTQNPDWVKDFQDLLKNSPNTPSVLSASQQTSSSIDLAA
jgi:hypothetical protein